MLRVPFPSTRFDMDTQNKSLQRHQEMTGKPVQGLIVKLALPTMASMLLTSVYNLADTFYVSRISTSASAAAGVAFPMLVLIQAISIGLAMGGSSFAARCLGAEQNEKANQTVSTAFFLSILVGTSIGAVILLRLSELLLLLGATQTILPYARDYGFYIILATPFYSATFVLTAVLRQEGSPSLAMFGSVFGAVLNILLDPVFIFGLGLQVKGAAIATSLSQTVTFAIMMGFVLRGRTVTRIALRYVTFNRQILSEILRIGLPECFRQGLACVAGILLNVAASAYGDSALAAISIGNRIIQFIFSMLMGFGQGFMPVCGYNFGARKPERVLDSFRFAQALGTGMLTCCSAVILILAPQLMALFRAEDAEVIRIGSAMLRIQAVLFPIASFVILSNMLYQACGEGRKAAVISLARQGLFFIPIILLLPGLLGLYGVLLSQPVADVLTGICCVPMTVSSIRMVKSQLPFSGDEEA